MDFKIFGLIDIIFLALLVITIIIGYKKGFMKKVISLFGLLIILALSVMLASSLAQLLKSTGLIYPSIFSGVEARITNAFDESLSEAPSYSLIIERAYGIPAFFSTLLSWMMGNPTISVTEEYSSVYEAVVAQAPTQIASSLLIVISFAIIFILSWIVLIILKIIADALRESKFVRVVDGILGIILSVVVFLVSFAGILFVLKLIRDNMNWQWFNNFIDTDLKLNDNSFRICKGLYNSNIYEQVKNFFLGFFKN